MKENYKIFLVNEVKNFKLLEELVKKWQPEKKKYEFFDELFNEFLSYFTKKSNNVFPNSYKSDLCYLLDKYKYEYLYKTKIEMNVKEELAKKMYYFIGAQNIDHYINDIINDDLKYRHIKEKPGKFSLDCLEEGKQKNDYDTFRYMGFKTIEQMKLMVKKWQPKKQNYKNVEEITGEFLIHYRKKAKMNFPDALIKLLEWEMYSKEGIEIKDIGGESWHTKR